jgi:outer membrane lipoprotein-sorting protein
MPLLQARADMHALSAVRRALIGFAAAIGLGAVLAPATGLAQVKAQAQAQTQAQAPTQAQAEGFDLAALMAAMRAQTSGDARFTERRHVALLDQVLESSGRLSFEAPDTFVRETVQPRPERITVKGNTLTVQQGGRTRTMALDAAPEAALIIDALRATLTGQRELLERHFDIALSGPASAWLLSLTPRDLRLRAQVISVRLAGHGGVVREVLVALPDGDRSVMSIEPVSAPRSPR